MEASVDPLSRGPDWKPITPKTGSLLHAETHAKESNAMINATTISSIPPAPSLETAWEDMHISFERF